MPLLVRKPAGALTITVLDDFKKPLEARNVVCDIVSGSNNDITRYR